MKNYWHSYIGPVESENIKAEADFPKRMTVKEAYYDVIEKSANICSLGSGEDEKFINVIEHLSYLSLVNYPEYERICEEILKIDM